jgi:hypothetical protein
MSLFLPSSLFQHSLRRFSRDSFWGFPKSPGYGEVTTWSSSSCSLSTSCHLRIWIICIFSYLQCFESPQPRWESMGTGMSADYVMYMAAARSLRRGHLSVNTAMFLLFKSSADKPAWSWNQSSLCGDPCLEIDSVACNAWASAWHCSCWKMCMNYSGA